MPVDYGHREKPYELYRKGKREGTWDPDEYDLQQDKEDWSRFSESERRRFLASCSGFYDGEENVTRTLAPYMMALDALPNGEMPFDTVQEEIYLAQQVYEEAKHTDFFSRYFEEVFGTQDTEAYRQPSEGYGTEDLYDTAEELQAAVAEGDRTELVYTLAEAYLNYMGIIEAQLARAGYASFDQMIGSKAEQAGREELLPAFQAAVGKIRQDETRHIENGRWMMKRLADAEPGVVGAIYEPRMKQYVENKILAGPMYDEQPFEGYDRKPITEQARQHLQDTIDYVGRDRFEELADVEAAVERMRSVSS